MAKEILCFFLALNIIAISSSYANANDDVGSPFSDDELDTGGLSRDSFPKGFIFGTATSAYQVEGMASKDGRGPSIWDIFISQPGLEPKNATGEVSVDQYHLYKVKGSGRINWKGVAYYNRLIDYMLEKGITPYANLNHYDLPQALQERYGGWLSEKVVKDFADYAEFCFKTFGDRVKNWFSFNEPRVVAALGYDTGFFAPGRCSKEFGDCEEGDSSTEPYIVAHNLIKCHAAASLRYRLKYQAEQQDDKNGVPIGPRAYSDWLYNVPWGLYKVVMYVKERYGNPTIILAENGMDQPGSVTLPDVLIDTTRIEYYKSYLKELKKTIEDGANVIGYMAWSLLDNFEWRLGYTSRFGITFVDFDTLKRYPKMSAHWFQKMLRRE
ncbi:hypothetical protein M9H77_34314 [Catharanthus roseus]|uniref:Uncharacterized protein n=1 Tax=Catharanthus roseus TaxID=4058 RepID=A0ACB9ZLP6_CATRO|nr:hypothetical protein M9H77_34314 [Catharanthus roseus]